MARSSARSAAPPKRRSLKVRSGDRVEVIAGKDRGKQGRVLRVDPQREKVFVEGLNIVKRHMRPQQVAGAERQTVGGVIEQEGPIHVSNVMVLDPKDGKRTRIGIEREDGKRYRVAKATGRRLD